MFIWLNKQGVRSDAGFEVQFTGRFDAEYREENKVVELYVEDGLEGGLPCVIVGTKALQHWSDGTAIDPAKQAEIIKNFKAAMDFQGLGTVVDNKR
jgi:hypothetical protein